MKSKTAAYYDKLYTGMGKDYASEALQLRMLLERQLRSPGRALLDVACGTGRHARFLSDDFDVTGIDIEPAMLEIARRECAKAKFHQGDMRDFDISRTFDAVICLFSSIGFMTTEEDLDRAISNMARHLAPGGVLVIEPWLTPEHFTPGTIQVLTVDEPDLKVARVTHADRRGTLSILDMQYLIATADSVQHVAENYELGLFSHERYLAAFEAAGLEVAWDEKGLMNRGLFIAEGSGG